MLFDQRPPRARRAFTLVELLTVIVIIGILAGLVTAAAMRVRVSVRKAAIVLELKQIEMAMSMYKDRFGEFPPDDLRFANWLTIRRHLAKAFPRYRPGVSTRAPIGTGDKKEWEGFQADVRYFWGLDIKGYTYGETITFFLGGQPEWTSRASTGLSGTGDIFEPSPVIRFAGFSANPENPFASGGSRIDPFYEFAPEQLVLVRVSNHSNTTLKEAPRLLCWPKGIVNTATASGAMAYFRAENGNYFYPGTKIPKRGDWDLPSRTLDRAWPAVDGRQPLPNTVAEIDKLVWINPRSFQLFSSGIDMKYDAVLPGKPTPDTNNTFLLYPNGPYTAETLDDFANFATGTLEDAMP